MSAWVDGEEQDILELWFAGTALPLSATHIGLFTTNPNDAGSGGTEATGGSYVREAFARNGTNWGNSSAGAPSSIESLIDLEFTAATASWGTIVGWGYFTASSGGTLLYWAALGASKVIDTDDTARFLAGTLLAELGDPGDGYT